MKKWFIVLVVLLSPLMTFAKTNTKEDIMNFIENIQDTQVDEDIIIEKTTITNEEIILELLEKNRVETKNVSYKWEDNILVLTGGTIQLNEEPQNNQYAFYLYSIIENKTTAPYEENHYYNASLLQKLVASNSKKIIEDHNTGNTFSILLKEITPNVYQIEYHYNLAGDDASLVMMEDFNQEEILKNPNTGSIHFYITILLLIMLGITAYTYWGKNPIEKGV